MTARGLTALKTYSVKYTKRKKLEAEIEKLKAECALLERSVLEYFERHGIDRQTVGGYTIAPRYQIWASREEGIDAEQIYNALIDAGLHVYATESMNHQSFSAHIREIHAAMILAEQQRPAAEQRDIDIPALKKELWSLYPELEGKLAIREDLKISVTKTKKSTARTRIRGVMERKAAAAQRLPDEVEDDVID